MLTAMPLLHLTAEEARELQRDLIALMRWYRVREAGGAGPRRPFLLRLGFAPLTEDEVTRLYR